ncbi:MAG: hypothetical protein JWM95_2108 [Gemmatimonadetes bacterium]|nr:hypothetical protein [Gemmatimonadota bacterium]
MTKRDDHAAGNVKGAQAHAEGQHGERTRERIAEISNQSRPDPDDNIIASDRTGKQRIRENREQHDEAERNSEFNRMDEGA